MKQIVIYLEILDLEASDQVSKVKFSPYEKPWLKAAQEIFPEAITYDLDNHSETLVVDYALRLIEEAEQVLCILEVKSQASISSLFKIFEKIIRKREKCQLIFNGEHPVVEKMTKPLSSGQIYREVALEELKTLF